MSIQSLSNALKVLDYDVSDLSPNTKIPDDIADIIRLLHHYQDVNLLDIVEDTLIRRQSKNQYGHVFPWGVGCIDSDSHVGSIEEINPEQMSLQHDENNLLFWIEEIVVQLTNGRTSRIKIAEFTGIDSSPLFSVLIGYNGVGKSSMLRELVDFFKDLHLISQNPDFKPKASRKKPLSIVGVRYHIDGKTYDVVKLDNSYYVSVGGRVCTIDHLRLPSIVASSFGTFNKFPIQAVSGSGLSRYNTAFYKYVGVHVNGNMISASSIAFRLLFSLNENMDEKQQDNVCSLLDFIGYEHKITLQYSCKSLSKKQGPKIKEIINQGVQKDQAYNSHTAAQKSSIVDRLYGFFLKKITSGENRHSYSINIDRYLERSKEELQYIYKLRKYELINSVSVCFYKNGEEISTEEMSSGEFSMMSMILSISASVKDTHTLILIDEPEISQHPNWQMAFIDNLDRSLKNTPCHLLIATHSHMLVSDLPMNRSSVTQFEKDPDGTLKASRVLEETYGWSAEEVLLKVFKTATDRNRYFGERIGKLLERMAENAIAQDEAKEELQQLKEISLHLSDVDPMKMVLNTILETYQV